MFAASAFVICLFASLECASAVRYVPFTPCPKLFNYFESQTYEVFGAMTFENDLSGKYELEVNMSIATDTDKNIRISRRTDDYNIQNGDALEYYVHFPFNHTFPKLTSITFNGKLWCVGPPEEATPKHGVTALSATDKYATRIVDSQKKATTTTTTPATPAPSFIQIVINNNHYKCADYKPMFPGRPSAGGHHPWLVAIFSVRGAAGYEFVCGGSLLSAKHVLTAAHCMRNAQGSNLSVEDLIVVLGGDNIRNWARRSITRGVREFYTHPDYKKPADADLAVLVLDETVAFGDAIQPVQLWDDDDDVVNETGTVAGWGKDEEQSKLVRLPIVSQETCLRSDERFLRVTSARTFCAGNAVAGKEGSGPCAGYGGSGFVVERDDIWKLRGVVSTALLDSSRRTCDVDSYVVFADVPKYSSWIRKVMDTL